MKKLIASYNSHSSSDIKSFLMLDSSQIILDIAVGLLMIVSFNIPIIWANFTSGAVVVTSESLGQFFNEHAPWLYNFFSDIADGRAIQMLLWLFIGCTAYLILWFVGSFLTSLRNDVIADSYTHPKFYTRFGFWLSVISRKFIFVCLCVILIVYVYAAIGLFYQLSAICYEAIADFQLTDSLINLTGSLITAALLAQIFFILFKLVASNWKIIYNDL